MYNLGINYYYGLGCEKNLQKSKEFFQKASDLGYDEGYFYSKNILNLIHVYMFSNRKNEFSKIDLKIREFCL